MKKIIQNFIASVSGYLNKLNTTNKDTLVDAINEINSTIITTPYKILSGQISQRNTDDPYFIEWENTTGTNFTFTRIGVGYYRATPNDFSNLGNPSLPKSYAIVAVDFTSPVTYLQVSNDGSSPYFDFYYGQPDSPSDNFGVIYFSIEFLMGAA